MVGVIVFEVGIVVGQRRGSCFLRFAARALGDEGGCGVGAGERYTGLVIVCAGRGGVGHVNHEED